MSESKKKIEMPAKGSKEPEEQSFRAEGKTISKAEIVKVLLELGGVNLTSTQIRDKLGLKERDPVRRLMNQLAEAGVVKIEEKPSKEGAKGSRFFYTLMEQR